jgi:hypothetical protein
MVFDPTHLRGWFDGRVHADTASFASVAMGRAFLPMGAPTSFCVRVRTRVAES